MLKSLLHLDPYRNLFSDHTAARLAKALSPRYAVSRLALTLYEVAHPDLPWLTRDAIRWLEGNLSRSQRGFEWGSGTGTAWLAQRTGSLVSVEHSPAWHERVRSHLERLRIDNVDYRLVAEPDYVATMREFPEDHFDWVLVDGLFRDEALLASLPRVRPGGFVIFDNVNWYLPSESRTPHSRSLRDGPATSLFAAAAMELAGWHSIWTTNGVNDTALFLRPFTA